MVTAFLDAIRSGKLQPGERVSSSRELQAHYGISRNTALNALSQLQAEGYLVTVPGSGTFVAGEPNVVPADGAVPFRPGIPVDLFPTDLFKRSLSTLEWTQGTLDNPRSWSDDRLRASIAQRLKQTRGVVCSPDQVLIVPSTQYAISLIWRALLRPCDDVVVEDPGCPNVRSALLSLGARIVPVPVDDEGIDVAAFARRRAGLAYVTPSHQFPTGAALSRERRFALLDWAAEFDAWIVEDDYDGEFDYRRRPPTTLQSLDEGRRVLYLGSFCNVLSPSISIAYVIAPRSLCGTLRAAHQATAGYASPILQAAIAAFMERGHLDRHVAKMYDVYDERRRFLSFALGSTGLRVRDWGAGLHFIADLPDRLLDKDVSARAAERGVVALPLSSYVRGGRSTMNGLVLGFAATPISAARTAVKSLLKAL
ncbi:MAG TPA: PLP-dependent aminotransferase family protein [Candidatus Baltobacteraceae bacterium]|nr:PLP-dependent aminotransferase family protein [Candidatus Baltobacteraceae bacterium]